MTLVHATPASSPVRLVLAAAGLCAALLGCTSSGDGGVAPPAGPMEGAVFVSDAPPAGGGGYVSLRQTVSTRRSTCLAVEVTDAVDVFSVAFDLEYDPGVLDLQPSPQGFSVGDFLGDDVLEALADGTGVATVGVSRRSNIHATGVAGDGTVAELCFDLIGTADDSPLEFTSNLAALDSSGAVEIGAARFVGGSVTVR